MGFWRCRAAQKIWRPNGASRLPVDWGTGRARVLARFIRPCGFQREQILEQAGRRLVRVNGSRGRDPSWSIAGHSFGTAAEKVIIPSIRRLGFWEPFSCSSANVHKSSCGRAGARPYHSHRIFRPTEAGLFFQEDGDDRNIGRGNPADASRLTQGGRSDVQKLLTRFRS
jgi:hypothetical protein